MRKGDSLFFFGDAAMKKTISIIGVVLGMFSMGAAIMMPLSRVRADGFGITPPYVTSDQLTQNSHYEQNIILVRSNPTDDLQAKVTINVPGANNWITIDRGTQFILPAGTQQEPMIVSVNVPSNAKLGNYSGNIQVVVSPAAGPTKGTVGITIGAQIDVDLTVIDSHMAKLALRRVAIKDNATEAGHTLWWMHFPGRILFSMDLNNTGNIPGTPAKVVFQYQDYLTGNVIETEQNTNGLDAVKPFDTKTVTAEMPTFLPQGTYRVHYQVMGVSGSDVLGEGTLDLSVLAPGALPDYVPYGIWAAWGLSWTDRLETIGVLVLILLILIGLFFGIRSLFRRGSSGGRGRHRVPAPPPMPPRYR